MMKPPFPADEAARLAALRDYDVLDTPPEQAFDDLARLASQICGTPVAMVSLVDGGRQWFKARVGTEVTETPRALARQAMDQFRLRRHLKQLQELEALRDSLTHLIVHDMRTPLTSLIAGLQTLGRLGELNETQAELLGLSIQGGQ